MSTFTGVVLCGAGVGAGLLLIVATLRPHRLDLAVAIGRFDAARRAAAADASRHSPPGRPDPGAAGRPVWRDRLGHRAAAGLARRGVGLSGVRADLELLGRSLDALLGTKIVLAAYGLVLPLAATGLAHLAGLDPLRLPAALPAACSLALAAALFLLPDVELRRAADRRRRELLRAFTVFLNLVGNTLAGGRGIPEALPMSAGIGRSWPFRLLADTIAAARLTGRTPWQHLADLGRRINVAEIEEFGAQVGLVADEGAKIRESLAARADSLRRKQLTDTEGKAGVANESMEAVVAAMGVIFLLFLVFPALYSFGLA